MFAIKLHIYGELEPQYFVSKYRLTGDLQRAKLFIQEARAKRIALWCLNKIPDCIAVELGEVRHE